MFSGFGIKSSMFQRSGERRLCNQEQFWSRRMMLPWGSHLQMAGQKYHLMNNHTVAAGMQFEWTVFEGKL